MRGLQPSFARGEISPLLHARVDLALYMTALASLKNMIVLPQGGVTRRPGFIRMDETPNADFTECPVRLVPFRYNTEDAMIVEISSGRLGTSGAFRFWTSSGGLVTKNGAPYVLTAEISQTIGDVEILRRYFTDVSDLTGIRFAQSGNVIFLAHRKYPPAMLVRNALNDWSLRALEFEDGPWVTQDADAADTTITVQTWDTTRVRLVSSEEGFFSRDMVGSLFKLSFTVEGDTVTGESLAAPDWYVSAIAEVATEWYLQTYNNWQGTVEIQKSYDGGENWITVRKYSRVDYNKDGQASFSGSEADKNVLYRIRAQHTNDVTMKFDFEVSGYTKDYIFRLLTYFEDGTMLAERIYAPGELRVSFPFYDRPTKDWALGAWNDSTGYPGCIAFYQDRLVLAGSAQEPQTVWMSKIGDYKSFSRSDPMRDDDAINITISAEDMDGIHSLVAMSDVMVFTASSEWKISGAGENGAISPNAVVAHRQDEIGSASMQPIVCDGQIILVQTHRTEVDAMRYSFDVDGYTGSKISIISQHLFQRRILHAAYQQIPDSILWFALEDGTVATCTFQTEHELVGWARQITEGSVGCMTAIPRDRYSELWAAVRRRGRWAVEKLAEREAEARFFDDGTSVQIEYESSLETLRINLDGQNGSLMAAKKHIPRVAAFALNSVQVKIAPASNRSRSKWQALKWPVDAGRMVEMEIMMDGGYERDAGIQMWTEGRGPLTLLGLSPMISVGG